MPNSNKGYRKWKKDLPDNLRKTKKKDYNMRKAFKSGAREFWVEEDQSYHMPSRVPQTGEYLKAVHHPTVLHAAEGDREIGYEPTIAKRFLGKPKLYTGSESDPAKIKGKVIAEGDEAIKYLEEQRKMRKYPNGVKEVKKPQSTTHAHSSTSRNNLDDWDNFWEEYNKSFPKKTHYQVDPSKIKRVEYVDSENDPRYTAYQDSLYTHNLGENYSRYATGGDEYSTRRHESFMKERFPEWASYAAPEADISQIDMTAPRETINNLTPEEALKKWGGRKLFDGGDNELTHSWGAFTDDLVGFNDRQIIQDYNPPPEGNDDFRVEGWHRTGTNYRKPFVETELNAPIAPISFDEHISGSRPHRWEATRHSEPEGFDDWPVDQKLKYWDEVKKLTGGSLSATQSIRAVGTTPTGHTLVAKYKHPEVEVKVREPEAPKTSLVELMKERGLDSSFDSRKKLYESYGLEGEFKGTREQGDMLTRKFIESNKPKMSSGNESEFDNKKLKFANGIQNIGGGLQGTAGMLMTYGQIKGGDNRKLGEAASILGSAGSMMNTFGNEVEDAKGKVVGGDPSGLVDITGDVNKLNDPYKGVDVYNTNTMAPDEFRDIVQQNKSQYQVTNPGNPTDSELDAIFNGVDITKDLPKFRQGRRGLMAKYGCYIKPKGKKK